MRPKKSRNDLELYLRNTEILVEGACEEIKDEITICRSDIQSQLHDLFNEIQRMRKELIYRRPGGV